jgi:hypothetical protein
MADDTLVSNNPLSNNPDIPVRGTASTDPSHTGKVIQHMRLDKGSGGAESVVTDANPLPTTATISGTANVNLTQVNGAAVSLGKKPANNSIPTVLSVTQQDGLVQGDDVLPMGVWGSGAGQFTAWDGGVIQNGNWSVRIQDGSGNALTSTTGTPAAADRGLVTRNINYLTDSLSGTPFSAKGNSAFGTSYATLLTNTGANIAYGNGTVGVSNNVQRVTIASDSTGQIKALTNDSSGNGVASATAAVTGSERGLYTNIRVQL